jgi:hypothetical protein
MSVAVRWPGADVVIGGAITPLDRGVGRGEQAFRAHAWIQCGEVEFGDSAEWRELGRLHAEPL